MSSILVLKPSLSHNVGDQIIHPGLFFDFGRMISIKNNHEFLNDVSKLTLDLIIPPITKQPFEAAVGLLGVLELQFKSQGSLLFLTSREEVDEEFAYESVKSCFVFCHKFGHVSANFQIVDVINLAESELKKVALAHPHLSLKPDIKGLTGAFTDFGNLLHIFLRHFNLNFLIDSHPKELFSESIVHLHA